MAETKYQRLIRLLKDMFQLGDAAELDFGIYRIMHARKAEIENFLDQELFQKHVKEALAKEAGGQRQQIEAEIDELAQKLKDVGEEDPTKNKKYKELVDKREAEPDQSALEDEVYANLLTFFGRYYSEGDFISQRRYGDDTYAIPYNGEEVKLYWANHDQYYIKSAEDLKHYAFLVGSEANRKRVRFKLVAASTERDNVKEKAGQERWHIVSDREPITEEAGELVIPFEYRVVDRQELVDRLAGLKAAESARPQTGKLFKDATEAAASADDAATEEAEAEIGKRPNMRDQLAAIGAKSVLASDIVSASWRQVLEADYKNAEGDASGRSVIEHHIRRYLAKATFDYFIHKDLGGFLRRELDWFIKHELLQLQNVLDDGQTLDQLGRRHFAKLRVLRTVAGKMIDFLAQLEEFQKKLWLKKKFVAETNYCVSLDNVPEALYEEVAANTLQHEEWVALFAVDETEGWEQGKRPSVEFLRNNSSLMIDTKLFPASFKQRLISRIENINEVSDGVLVHGDNFQALALLHARYGEQVKCIYIDPPYNTSSSVIPYKNDYRHSAWATMIRDRLELLRACLPQNGAIFVSIDKLERTVLEHALDEVFGRQNRVEELIWSMNTNNSQAPNYSTNHEYVLVYARDRQVAERDRNMFREPKPGYAEVMTLIAKLSPEYPPTAKIEEEVRLLFRQHREELAAEAEALGMDADSDSIDDPWKGLYNYNRAEYRDQDGRLVSQEKAQQLGAQIWVWRESDSSMPATKQALSTRDPDHSNWRFYTPPHPETGRPCPHPKSGWKFPYSSDDDSPDRRTFESLDRDGRIAWGEDERKVPQMKRFLHEVETNVGKSVFQDYSDGEKQTSAMFGQSGVFLAPKHSDFVARFIGHSAKSDSLVLDCFGGSGSTAHSVINMNRLDGGTRKFVTVEVEQHFDSVLKPRICKAMYSREWRGGKPIDREGVGCFLQYITIESYEDACDNVFLEPSKKQQEAFEKLPGAEREKYRLHYMLDVESRGSASLLNIEKFDRPFEYTLRVTRDDVTREQNVDLVETFNWLLGLKVETIRLSKDKSFKDEHHGIVEVTGEDPDGNRCLVVWRNTDEVDDAMLIDWFKKNRYKVKDFEWHLIYVNGDNTLENLKRDDESWTVRLIEQEFHRLMFEGTE